MLTSILDDSFNASRVTFGGASISGEAGGYGFGDMSETEALKLIEYAYDRGINIFDTAPIYGFNSSEIRLSKALKDKRDKVKIISKCGVDWHPNMRVNMSNDVKVTQKMLNNTLRNFDHIDIYMVHWPDKNIDIRYPLEVLALAQQKGDLTHIGLCNTNQDDLNKATEVCNIKIVQSECNLFQNQLKDLSTSAFKMGWGTFDKGILTGSVRLDSTFDKSDCRSWAPWWKKSNWKEKVLKVEKLKEFIKDKDISLLELSLGYNLVKESINSTICGFRNQKQLDSIFSALENLPKMDLIDECRVYLE